MFLTSAQVIRRCTAVPEPTPVPPAGPAGESTLSIEGDDTVRPDPVTFTITGDLDIVTAPAFAAQFDAVVDRGHRDVHLDVRAVTFCDAAGLNVVVAVHEHLAALGGQLVVYGPCAPIEVLLAVLGPEVGIRLAPRPTERE